MICSQEATSLDSLRWFVETKKGGHVVRRIHFANVGIDDCVSRGAEICGAVECSAIAKQKTGYTRVHCSQEAGSVLRIDYMRST